MLAASLLVIVAVIVRKGSVNGGGGSRTCSGSRRFVHAGSGSGYGNGKRLVNDDNVGDSDRWQMIAVVTVRE